MSRGRRSHVFDQGARAMFEAMCVHGFGPYLELPLRLHSDNGVVSANTAADATSGTTSDTGIPVTTWSEDVVSGVNVLSTTTTTASDFTQDEAQWFLGRPRHVEMTNCASGGGASLAECEKRTREFIYDEAQAEVEEEVTEPGDPLLELTTEYFRNDGPGGNGRTINRTRTDFSGTQRVERFGWDSNGVHLEWSSNCYRPH